VSVEGSRPPLEEAPASEIERLRAQVSLERRHMAEVKNACRAALAAGLDEATLEVFCTHCADYLTFIMPRFNAQDRAHCELLRPRLTPEDESFRPVLEDLEATLRMRQVRIDELARALQARRAGKLSAADFIAACRTYVDYFETVLAKRRHVIYPLFEKHYGAEEWRKASFIDADSIRKERERYARLEESLPAGVELKSASRPT
jgi:hypothetical protein